MNKLRKFAWIMPLSVGISWGCAGIFVRTLFDAGLSNITVICLRMLVGTFFLGLGILVYRPSLFKVKKEHIWLFAANGIIGMAGLNIFYNVSIAQQSLALSSVLLALNPVIVIFFAAAFLHESLTVRKLACAALALGGCVLVSGVLEAGSAMHWTVIGSVCGLISAVFTAAYNVTSKALAHWNYHFLTVTFYGTLFSAIGMIPFSKWHGTVGVLTANHCHLLLILVIYVFVTHILPYILYSVSMDFLEAGKVAILASGEPASSMVFGMFWYGENPSILSVLGIVMTISAMVILNLPGRSEKVE